MTRYYLAFTPYHLILANALQIGAGDPPAVILFCDESHLGEYLSTLGIDLSSGLGGATLQCIDGVERLNGFALYLQSRRNVLRAWSLVRANRPVEGIYLFNALRAESQRLVTMTSVENLHYVEDGLDSYLAEALVRGSYPMRRYLLECGMRAIPSITARRLRGFTALNSHNTAEFGTFHLLFPEAATISGEAGRVEAIAHEWFRASVAQLGAAIRSAIGLSSDSRLLTHVKMLSNTERVEVSTYLAEVRRWAESILSRDPGASPAVKPHPRERDQSFLSMLDAMPITVLPHQIPAELLVERFAPDCHLEVGPTTFVMTSKVLLPDRRVDLDPSCSADVVSFIGSWEHAWDLDHLP